jgi:hypothetical protein
MYARCFVQAKLFVDAQAGDRHALLQIMTDQTANVYGECCSKAPWGLWLGIDLLQHVHMCTINIRL